MFFLTTCTFTGIFAGRSCGERDGYSTGVAESAGAARFGAWRTTRRLSPAAAPLRRARRGAGGNIFLGRLAGLAPSDVQNQSAEKP